MRVVTRALSMASIVSGRPGPVPGAGANCGEAGCAERDPSRIAKRNDPTDLWSKRFTQPPLLSPFDGHFCKRPLSHFTRPNEKCKCSERDFRQPPFSRGAGLPEKPGPAEHGQHRG